MLIFFAINQTINLVFQIKTTKFVAIIFLSIPFDPSLTRKSFYVEQTLLNVDFKILISYQFDLNNYFCFPLDVEHIVASLN